MAQIPKLRLLDIKNLSGGLEQNLATQNTDKDEGWLVNTGTAAIGGPTGTYRAQFGTTNPGSNGNFLDAIIFDISAFAVLTASIDSDLEANGDNIPRLIINGNVDVDTTIPVNITGGTALAGDDFVQTSSTLLIPAGLYFDDELALPITINDNLIVESDETIIIELGMLSTQEVILKTPSAMDLRRKLRRLILFLMTTRRSMP